MADPFYEPLPSMGQVPWSLDGPIQELRDRVAESQDVIETGRLSEDGLEIAIATAAAELETAPANMTDAFIAGRINTNGSLTQNALLNKAASSAEFDTLASEVGNLADEVEGLSRTTFDIDRARLTYGLRLDNYSNKRLMQAFFISDKLDGEIFYTQIDGSDNGVESVTVTRCAPNGRPMGGMRLAGAGHGHSMFVEVASDGSIFVWTYYTDYRFPASDINRYNIVRLPWVAGTQHTIITAEPYRVNSLSRTGSNVLVYFDEKNSIVGTREAASDDDQATATFKTFSLANVLSGAALTPLTQMVYTRPSSQVGQGNAYYEGKWYLYSGTSPTTSPYGEALISVVDANTGFLLKTVNVERARYQGAYAAPANAAAWSEPEGLQMAFGPNGTPALAVGMSYGFAAGRNHALFALEVGESPFRSGSSADSEFGNTGWCAASEFMTSFQSGFSADTTATRSFEARVAGGYLEFRGQVAGTFIPGTNFVGQLRTGFTPSYYKAGIVQVVIGKQAGSGTRSVGARMEINEAGELRVYTSADETSNSSWVSFDNVRIPLRRAGDGVTLF